MKLRSHVSKSILMDDEEERKEVDDEEDEEEKEAAWTVLDFDCDDERITSVILDRQVIECGDVLLIQVIDENDETANHPGVVVDFLPGGQMALRWLEGGDIDQFGASAIVCSLLYCDRRQRRALVLDTAVYLDYVADVPGPDVLWSRKPINRIAALHWLALSDREHSAIGHKVFGRRLHTLVSCIGSNNHADVYRLVTDREVRFSLLQRPYRGVCVACGCSPRMITASAVGSGGQQMRMGAHCAKRIQVLSRAVKALYMAHTAAQVFAAVEKFKPVTSRYM